MSSPSGPGGLLGQVSAETVWQVMMWMVVIIAAAMVFMVVAKFIRRAAVGQPPGPVPGLTVEQVDRMYRRGMLTEAEYERARRAAMGVPGAPPAGGTNDAEAPPKIRPDADADQET